MKKVRLNPGQAIYTGLFVSILMCISAYAYCQNNTDNLPLGLPPLLTGSHGEKIVDSQTWQRQRRSEVLSLFANAVYGDMPADVDRIRFKALAPETTAMNGKARLKQVAIVVTRKNQSLTIKLVLFIPVNAPKPAPVFLLINHREKTNIDPSRRVKTEFWPAEAVINRGYAIAAFDVSDVAPDNPLTYQQGALRLYPEQVRKANGMKAIGCWAWGASRVMDYLVTERAVDALKVAVVGHSRGGKAALWCGAQDERFALTISNNSGCTGAALSRRHVGERVADINKTFPYWFCTNYRRYNAKEETLPIDQHMLLALLAPRAVYVASASEDSWADPVGEFLSLKYAEPVYSLFKLLPLPVANQPAVGVPVRSSHMGYHLRGGGHGLFLYDWERFMDFADAYYAGNSKHKK